MKYIYSKLSSLIVLLALIIGLSQSSQASNHEGYDPFKLLQEYYYQFKSIDSAKKNIDNYYYDFLIQFHEKENISKNDAIKLDIDDFVHGSVNSYLVSVLNDNRFYYRYKYFDYVSANLSFEIIRADSVKSNFTTRIIALIIKKSKIIAIGSNLDVSKIQDLMIRMDFENNYLYHMQNTWRATECVEDSCKNDDHRLYGTITISDSEFVMGYGSPCYISGYLVGIEDKRLKFNMYFTSAIGSNSFDKIASEETKYVNYEIPIGKIEILNEGYMELTWYGVAQESDRNVFGNSYYSAFDDQWLFRLEDVLFWGMRPAKFGTNRIILKKENRTE